jgi:hypothetical protein
MKPATDGYCGSPGWVTPHPAKEASVAKYYNVRSLINRD